MEETFVIIVIQKEWCFSLRNRKKYIFGIPIRYDNKVLYSSKRINKETDSLSIFLTSNLSAHL